ncbi:UMP kinase [Tumebacillus flagellatus]|uniref:Uridylate kinase n=1 Tax=Tumebacillus flagellatus TaxID=1157490 RepID=A0A074MCY5_9BACL|nr:uridylate kinase [Tumebacillus flagellatus]
MENRRYNRVLIKLSGAAVAGSKEFGFDSDALEHLTREVLSVANLGVEVAVVIGGGNIFRGNVADNWGIERAEADNIGVMGTVLNSLMLRSVLKARSAYEIRVLSAFEMNSIAEPYIRLRALHHLEKGYLLILAGGTGQPYVSTDYPAVQRALELRCDAILVAKHGVNGIFTADPKLEPAARCYETISYEDVVANNLKVMDQAALLLARDYHLPLHIFDIDSSGTMEKILLGHNVGTYVAPHTTTRIL